MKKNNFKEMERELGQKGFTNSGKDDRQKKKKKKKIALLYVGERFCTL